MPTSPSRRAIKKTRKKHSKKGNEDISKDDNGGASQEALKPRVAGLPEPTSLPTPAPRSTVSARSAGRMGSRESTGSDRGDPNGMERLKGESEAEHVVRQTRLRDEEKQRMVSKFGGGGVAGTMSMSIMSGMDSNVGRMAGVGTDSSYNPSTGGHGAGAGLNVDVDIVAAGLEAHLQHWVPMARHETRRN